MGLDRKKKNYLKEKTLQFVSIVMIFWYAGLNIIITELIGINKSLVFFFYSVSFSDFLRFYFYMIFEIF